MANRDLERPEELLTLAIQRLRRVQPQKTCYIYPLWRRVGDMLGLTSDSALCARICRQFGFNPDEQWNPDYQWAQSLITEDA